MGVMQTKESMGRLRLVIKEAHNRVLARTPPEPEEAAGDDSVEHDQPLLEAAADLAAIGTGSR